MLFYILNTFKTIAALELLPLNLTTWHQNTNQFKYKPDIYLLYYQPVKRCNTAHAQIQKYAFVLPRICHLALDSTETKP